MACRLAGATARGVPATRDAQPADATMPASRVARRTRYRERSVTIVDLWIRSAGARPPGRRPTDCPRHAVRLVPPIARRLPGGRQVARDRHTVGCSYARPNGPHDASCGRAPPSGALRVHCSDMRNERPPCMPDEPAKNETVSENPEDVSGQDRLTVEADTEVPPVALIRRGWAASTFESFRSRDFSLFWSGALVSNIGTWMQNAAIAIVVFGFQPARASFNTGIVAGLTGLPVLFLAIPAGAVADRVDRRKLLIWIQVVLLFQAAALGILYDTKVLSPAQPVISLVLVSALGLVGGIFVALPGPRVPVAAARPRPAQVAHERHRAQLRAAPVLPHARTGDRRGDGARRRRDGARVLHQRAELPLRHRRAHRDPPSCRVPRRPWHGSRPQPRRGAGGREPRHRGDGEGGSG